MRYLLKITGDVRVSESIRYTILYEILEYGPESSANQCMLFKNGKRTTCEENYWTISLLPDASKIIEEQTGFMKSCVANLEHKTNNRKISGV